MHVIRESFGHTMYLKIPGQALAGNTAAMHGILHFSTVRQRTSYTSAGGMLSLHWLAATSKPSYE